MMAPLLRARIPDLALAGFNRPGRGPPALCGSARCPISAWRRARRNRGASIAKSTYVAERAGSSAGSRMEITARDELAIGLGTLVAEAGKAIMGLQAAEIGARRKPDGSPVSQADLRAEEIILARLAALMPG